MSRLKRRTRLRRSAAKHEHRWQLERFDSWRCDGCDAYWLLPHGEAPPTGRCRRLKTRKPLGARPRRSRDGDVYGPYHRWMSAMPCLRRTRDPDHRCVGAVVGHHVKSVGAGGKDYANEVPLCAGSHFTLHTMGQDAACRAWQIDFGAEAERIARGYPRDPGL